MNISLLSNFNPNIANNSLNSTVKGSNSGLNPNMSYPNLKPLQADKVSFGMRKLPKVINQPEGIIGQKVLNLYPTMFPSLIPIKDSLHGALGKACNRLSHFGFSYDPVYNARHPIKTEKSFNRKFKTQGSVKDLVRGTVYWKNQQDVEAGSQH